MDTKRLNATITFGVLSIPVGVVPVINSSENGVRFTNLHAKTTKGKPCLSPIKQPKHCPVCDVDVEAVDLVSGFKRSGSYIVVTEDEKASVAVDRSPIIEVTKFVYGVEDEARLNAQSSHWLVPEEGLPTKHFAVLREAMLEREVYGLAHASLWGKQWPVLLDARLGGIMLTKLYPVRAVRGWDVELPEPDQKLVELMLTLIGEFTGIVEDDDFTAPAQDALRELIEAKAMGETYVPPTTIEPEPTPDLQAALKASIKQIQAQKKRSKAAA